MELLSQAVMVQATIDVNAMTAAQKVKLADEIFVEQPNLLGSILVLPRMGVSMLQLEVPLHVLLVAFRAMKRSGHAWRLILEDVQEDCMHRLTSRLRFSEGLPGGLVDQAVAQFCENHSERYLLAFAYGYLGEHDLLRVRDDAEKFLLLAVLNLVECIAYTGVHTSSE